ncbi:MAG TPA: M23 family metallopeptidase [Myxococcaceae bacterium]|nr:M23 family metallopeptidase [Myxococcaceae bacterium]
MSFDELYSESEPSPPDAQAPAARAPRPSPPKRRKKQVQPPTRPPDSLELRSALITFSTRARDARQDAVHGSAMPGVQVENWWELTALLDAFLRQPARKMTSLDVVRAQVTLEAELEEDARVYGDIPAELADAVVARVDRLAGRMAELRQLQLQPSRLLPRFAWPVDPVIITSVFGSRRHPSTRRERNHLGLDLAAREGQLVSASSAGVVRHADWNGAHGLQVVVEHEGDVLTRYSHLSQVLVGPGERVEQGDVLGLAGKTGLATGTHLHFELWRDGRPKDPLEELGPTESGEEPVFVQGAARKRALEKRKGRRPTRRRPR